MKVKHMKVDKDFVDSFYRSILLDWLKNSKYQSNKKMHDYILYEASYENVLLAVTQNKPFLQERNDVETALAIKKAEDTASPFLDILGFLLGGFATDAAAKKFGVTSTQLAAKGLKPTSMKRIGAAASRFGAGWIVIPALLTWLAKKAIFGTLHKLEKKCNNYCASKISKNLNNRNLLLNICMSKCKIADINRSSAKLKSQLASCNSKDVKNPAKCKMGLYKTIARFNEMIEKEKIKLNKNMQKLQKKQQNK